MTGVVQALDVAVLDRRPDQGRGHRLGDRERGPALVRACGPCRSARGRSCRPSAPPRRRSAWRSYSRRPSAACRPRSISGRSAPRRPGAPRTMLAPGDGLHRRDLLHVPVAVELLRRRPGQDGAAGDGAVDRRPGQSEARALRRRPEGELDMFPPTLFFGIEPGGGGAICKPLIRGEEADGRSRRLHAG